MDRIGLIGVNGFSGTVSCNACRPWLSHEMVELSFCNVDWPIAMTGDDSLLMYCVNSCETMASSESEPLWGISRPRRVISFSPGLC